MFMRITSAAFLFCFCTAIASLGPNAYGQSFTQTVRGLITDQLNGQPVEGATLSISQPSGESKGVSNEYGTFRIENVRVGRHVLTVDHPEFQTYTIHDLVIDAGKEKVLRIQLDIRQFTSEEVEISSSTSGPEKIGERVFTVEQSQRYAATYYDPARLATSFPGVTTTSDESNNIVVRGNSPNGILWRMEGADIVNPNHLTNAGTFTDRLTQNGGGTIILSTQLLANSRFLKGPFSSQYGNALSGVFDIRLRPGNNEQYEFTFQPSLIGVDIAAEGPFSKAQKGSFLVNYRYSTVGLFNLIGLEVTPEDISYQDLAFNLTFPTERAGTFTFFGMGGLSFTRFDAPRQDSLINEQRDRFDVDFFSNMGAMGLTHKLVIGTRSFWQTTLIASGIESQRHSDLVEDNFETRPIESDALKQTKLSLSSSLTHKLGNQISLREGIFITQLGFDLQGSLFTSDTPPVENNIAAAIGNAQLIQPFVDLRMPLNNKLQLNLGLHSMFFSLNGSKSLEPRARLSFRPHPKHYVSIAYGLHSQLQLLGTYFTVNNQALVNEDLDFTKAHQFVFNYTWQLNPTVKLAIEPYYQALYNVPVSTDPNSSFSAINLLEGRVLEPLVNEGTGENYGIELSAEKTITQDYYFLLSSSFYESKYTGADGIKRDTRFNGNYMLNATLGREFSRVTKKNKHKVWGVNLRAVYQGGFRTTPIDELASLEQQRTVFDESRAFSEKLKDYFRLDLRLSAKRNKEKYTRTFALDILNLTNRENIAFQRYDWVQKQVVNKYNLGLFPLMSYRLEF